MSTGDSDRERSVEEGAGKSTGKLPGADDSVQDEARATPEPDDAAKEKAHEMKQAYDEDRPTAVLPGSDGMISGTAVNDWLDDGNAVDQSKEGGRGGAEADSTTKGKG